LKKKHLIGRASFFIPLNGKYLGEEIQMKEFQIVYNIYGTYSDGLLVGCGMIKAQNEDEALLRATLDLV
jgi:hypothetical protein